MKNYTDRVVAFIDILGFRNLIAATSAEPELIEKIADAVTRIHYRRAFSMIRTAQDQDGKTLSFPECAHTPRVYTFSDHIVYSLPADPAGLVVALTQCQRLFGELAHNVGVFARGAVTVGPLYDDNNYIFGPALVYANDLEKKVAKFPRIVLSSEALTLLNRLDEIAHMGDGPQGLEIPESWPGDPKSITVIYPKPKVLLDTDGQSFVDVFNTNPNWHSKFPNRRDPSEGEVMGPPDHSLWLSDVSRLVTDRLDQYADDERIASKYHWLRCWIDLAEQKLAASQKAT